MSLANLSHKSTLISVPGFHESLSRDVAEELLKGCSPGLYIIRKSLHFPGDYTLSISVENAIEHYRIKYNNQTDKKPFTIDDETYFNNFSELVKHYTKDADGLCCKLTLPLVQIDKGFKCSIYTNGLLIQKDDLVFHEQIGKGEFSEVFRADYKGSDVAVKIIKNKELVNLFMDEALVMSKLNHSNLVHLKGVVDSVDCLCIVTEYMAKGSLVDYLRSRGKNVITAHDQIKFARDVCAGMAYLEERGLVHRDLAARNVLLQDNGIAKVSDFGLALHSDSDMTTGSKIPVKWTAPEALKNHTFSCKSDVWSFGILLWEIYSFGRVPYPGILLKDVLSKLEEGHRMDPPDGCPSQIYKIMTWAWSWKPEDRPTFREISLKLVDMCSTAV